MLAMKAILHIQNWEEFARQNGYEVAYDGLVLEI